MRGWLRLINRKWLPTKREAAPPGWKRRPRSLVYAWCDLISGAEVVKRKCFLAAQAHMIDEIEAVKLLLEELISKHQAIEVTHIH